MGDLKHIFAILAVLVTAKESLAQNYRICATISHSSNCQALEKDGSRVSCTFVTDNIDCALKIANGTADFGVFTSEEVVLLAQQQPNVHQIVGSVKHQDRKSEQFSFQTVAVVKSTHQGGIEGLRNTGFCHPGYGVSDQRWSSRILKYFEQKVANVGSNCAPNAQTPAQSEVAAIAGFFKDACRPGPWSPDPQEDAKLKSEYPQLCQLCNTNTSDQSCQYNYQQLSAQVVGDTTTVNSHLQALQCLSDGFGSVSYVAWEHARDFLQKRIDPQNYSLLCEDNTIVTYNATSMNTSLAPCAWVKQPWSAVLGKTDLSTSLLSDLRTWLQNGRSTNTGTWTDFLDVVLFNEPSSVLDYPNEPRTLTEYVTEGRPIPSIENTPSCHSAAKWCTTSAEETLKCTWVQRAAYSLGLEPTITCVQSTSDLACLDNIQNDRSDFTSVDSNYGFLARQHYGLTAVLYHQTRRLESSRVVALVKESATQNITRFENLRDKNACFPEYGGIAWVSFIRAAHERGVISESECDYARAIGDFFGSTCAPGAADSQHALQQSADVNKLCSLCRDTSGATSTTSSVNEQGLLTQPSVEQVCAANYTNHYYGNNGTLACLSSPDTDVAFLEQQYINSYITELKLNVSEFRALCRNNSLAASVGVEVDDGCALSVTVDGEIVVRRNWQQAASLGALMKSLDELFGYNAGTNKLIDLQIFSPFNSVANLLFKDSTTGLASSDSTNEQVLNYVELYRHLDGCTSAATSIGHGLMLVTIAAIWHLSRIILV